MAAEQRRAHIHRIEELRGSSVICFLTSLRQNVAGQIAEDAVRVFFDHLGLLPERPVEHLDLFLCSNGGAGTVPWRLVSLFREYAKHFSVLLPYRAYSAASLIALGADEIVMHPFAEMGPIDPTVSNEFNPKEPATGRVLGISVEDVTAYVNFIKTTVGIHHEDELVRAIEILVQQVHPLALGNVERFLSQSRMIATKILRTHMTESEEHTINEIVENMASKLYFHGHPINRMEAKNELRLKVSIDLPPELETTMWDLYKDYETEFKNQDAFNPLGDLAELLHQQHQTASPATPAGAQTQVIPPQVIQQLAQAGLQVGPTNPVEQVYELLHAIIESPKLSSVYTTRRRFKLLTNVPVQPGQMALQEDLIEQGWSHSSAP